MTNNPSIARLAPRIRKALTAVNQNLLDQILQLVDHNGKANLADVLENLYPGDTPARAIKKYADFREAIRRVAGKLNLKFELETDGRTRTPHHERSTWFAAESRVEQVAAESMVKPQLTGPGVDTASVEPSGVQLDIAGDRQPVRCCVVWASEDSALRERLLKSLTPLFRTRPNHRIRVTSDIEVPSHSVWQSGKKTLQQCDIAVVLASPALLASRYAAVENLSALPGFRRIVPVAISPIPHPGAADLQDLDTALRAADGTTFSQQRTPESQKDFAAIVAKQIDSILDAAHAIPALTFAAKEEVDDTEACEELAERIREAKEYLPGLQREMLLRADIKRGETVDPRGARTSMSKDLAKSAQSIPEDHPESANREGAIPFLMEWIRDASAPSYCALLGEYGCGKTTTSKLLTLEILRLRDTGEKLPFPLYLDLRNIGKDAKRGLSLEEILKLVIDRNWKAGPAAAKVTPRELIDLVEKHGALVIWDGLDEVLSHLESDAGQLFTRQLYSIIPPNQKRPVKSTEPVAELQPNRRLLITCRTHYFRTLREQKTHFLAEDRDNVTAEAYRAFLLLPFTEGQIREYVAHTLPDENTDRVMETLDAVHNLRELAERPYTLSLIVQQFAAIEKMKQEGRTVTGLTLYRHVALSWLERDNPKHQFTADHKQLLMEFFAAELWRAGERFWSVADLEQWMMNFLAERPEFAAHYAGMDRELLKEDLRNATFLVREGEDSFRFAHTSLQEYFLAGYLRRALIDKRPELWDLPRVSQETLDFLGQWLSEETGRAKETALRSLSILRDGLIRCAAELAFAYFLVAAKKSYPNISGAGFKLNGADLREMQIYGTRQSPLILPGANFADARLRNSQWRYCNLTGATFDSALADRAEWLDCYLAESCWPSAALEGTVFRNSNLTNADFMGARCYHTKILNSRVDGPVGLSRERPATLFTNLPPDEPAFPCVSSGHRDWVMGCAWSGDSRRIVSSSDDNTLRVWDAASGECLLTLAGHEKEVRGCAWSGHSRRIVSASWDETLRVWDAASGECLLTLAGHENVVNGCAWSGDSRRIVSASDDKTLRIWDAASGECLLTLAGHENDVNGCAWSGDSRRIVSASDDKTLRIWDAASGECLLTLAGHENDVNGCAWSGDSRRIVSASDDKTLRIWDAASGECLLTLAGHANSVNGCAWSGDSRRIVSASWDDALRVWDAASGECLLTLAGHENDVNGCASSGDSRRIVSASDDKTLRIWDAASGECLLTLAGHENDVNGCAWSGDSRRIVSASDARTLRVWDAASGGCLLTLAGHENDVNGCAWSGDSRRIVSASWDKTLRVWDAASGGCLLTLAGHANSVNGCAWSGDSRRIVSASDDRTLRVWDAASGGCLLTLAGHERGVTGCAWSGDGRRIVSASDDETLRVWDAASGESVLTLAGHEGRVMGCAWSGDGRRIVSASDDETLRVWDAASGESVLTLAGHEGWVNGCAWSGDGRRIVSASDDRTLRVWEAASGECVLTLAGHEGGVNGCAWSGDGRRIVSASDDGSVRIWDAVTGKQLDPVMYHVSSLRGGPSWAAIDYKAGRIVAMGEEAWRSVGYVIPGEGDRPPEWLPAETFPIG